VLLAAIILLWLGIGAAITVGMAWTFAIFASYHALPGDAVPMVLYPPERWPYERPEGLAPRECARTTNPFVDTDHGGWGHGAVGTYARYQMVAAFGWPRRCLREWYIQTEVGRQGFGAIGAKPVALPCNPLWPGLLADTLFFAACAWGLWRLPLALRRRSRRRHGLCPRCAYSLAGLPENAACPECGRGHIANHT
jgi:hypothetical protein